MDNINFFEALGMKADFVNAAAGMKLMFDSFIEAGFTEDQSLKLILGTIQAIVNGGNAK